MGQKGSSTKQKICEVAEKLFAENGYKNVSTQDICDSSGMSKGGVYRHFSSKSELLLSLLQKEKRVFQDIQEGKSAIETLENLLNIYFEDMKNCKKSLAFALYEFVSTENKITLDSSNEVEKKYWQELVQYGVRTGEFYEVDSDMVMNTFLYAYRGVMMWGRILRFEEKTFENVIDSVRYMLIKKSKCEVKKNETINCSKKIKSR
jgi:AcrR family transcriptional regulator